MKFTIERRPLVKMVELVRIRDMPYHNLEAEIKLSACAARVFVATSGMVAGHEALVFEDGECFLPGKRFLKLLKSYQGKKNLTMEIDDEGLHIGNFTTPVRAYSPVTYPPGKFQVFPVTDLDVLSAEQQPAAPPPPPPQPAEPPPPVSSATRRGRAAPQSAQPGTPDWHTGCDPDVQTARIWQLQLTLFPRQPRELCEQLHLSWLAACQLYDDGFLIRLKNPLFLAMSEDA